MAIPFLNNINLTAGLEADGDSGSSGQVLSSTGTGTRWIDLSYGNVSGTGTTNNMTKWSNTTGELTDALMTDNGSTVSLSTHGGSNTFDLNHTSGSGIALNITKKGSNEALVVNKTSGSGNAISITGDSYFNGDVGIGTSSLTEKLEVDGNIKASSFITNNGTSSQFVKGDGTLDSNNFVDLTTNQAISGEKTFNDVARFNSDVRANADLIVDGNIELGAGGQITQGLETFTLPVIGGELVVDDNVLTLDNVTQYTPNADYEPATKKYVDDNAGGGGPYVDLTTAQSIAGIKTFTDEIRFDDINTVGTDLIIENNGARVMRALTTGGFSPSTSTAFFQLGDGSQSGMFTGKNGSALTNFGISTTNGLTVSPSSFASLPQPREMLDVYGAGLFTSTVTATNFILSSDERLKNRIQDVDYDEHINVNWKTFELITEPGVERHGVIAQELEKKHPEFVRTNNEGTKSVAYIDLLIAKIAELEARLKKAGI